MVKNEKGLQYSFQLTQYGTENILDLTNCKNNLPLRNTTNNSTKNNNQIYCQADTKSFKSGVASLNKILNFGNTTGVKSEFTLSKDQKDLVNYEADMIINIASLIIDL